MPRGRPRKTEQFLGKSAEMLGWALGGIEREIAETRERLALLNTHASRLRARLGRGRPAGSAPVAGSPTFDEPAIASRKVRRRRMSAEARKRISDMMKKRWAERRKAKA